jgi:predicted ATPase
MYRSFEIIGFRCFDHLVLPRLKRVNLIAGVNNVGKTALLEALFLHAGAYNPALTMTLDVLRGIGEIKIEFGRWTETPWDSIFRDFDTSRVIRLVGDNESTGRRTLSLRLVRRAEELAGLSQYLAEDRDKSVPLVRESAQVLELEHEEAGMRGKHQLVVDPKGIRIEPMPPNPPFPGFFVSDRTRSSREDADLFGKLEIENKQDALLRVLQLVEPKLRRLAIVVRGDVPMFYGDIGEERLLPLPLMGGGMTRLLSVVLRICNASNGVVFVDEIENGLHHSLMKEMWTAIGELARSFNAQVFATTHSLECIVAAHAAFAASRKDDFYLHRLERAKDEIRAVTYDQDALGAAIETGLEMR